MANSHRLGHRQEYGRVVMSRDCSEKCAAQRDSFAQERPKLRVPLLVKNELNATNPRLGGVDVISTCAHADRRR